MTPHLLIDAIVRQTTVLIGQLATTGGVRAPLAHVAADVFVSLVEELKDQGLGSKVIADMFGLALRTYHNRVRRYSESVTDRGVSLWEAVLSFVRAKGFVTRADVLRRFHADDEATVRAVLKDLVDTGLLFRAGRADRTTFRAAKPEEVAAVDDGTDAAAQFVRVLLHQQGPLAPKEIGSQLGLKLEAVRQALEQLQAEGQVQLVPGSDAAEPTYQASECVITYGDERGWEAALFDHYQAMVTAIAAKVRSGTSKAGRDDATGGSTYHFDLYPGHVLEQEILGLLKEARSRASDLRQRVDQASATAAEGRAYRVVFYAGQHVIRAEGEDGDEDGL
ncbi:MAG TPA: crosslink repair DNA glycosylase YcaQ family protein [Polyangiaceae bacterium]|nr:crosslink repair DNA glycosylase YcaQ family protein [Polyangiaceae bacterium]